MKGSRNLRKRPRVDYAETVTEDERNSDSETDSSSDEEDLFSPVVPTHVDWEVERYNGVLLEEIEGILIPKFHCVWANWEGEGKTSWLGASEVNFNCLNDLSLMMFKAMMAVTSVVVSYKETLDGLDELD